MRITFVISSLGFGGAERVMVTMANYWAGKNWPITLITLDDADPAYSLDPEVERVGLGMMAPSRHPLQAIIRNLRRVGALRRSIAISTPDVVISFMDRTNVLTLLATRGLGLPVVVSDRIDPILYPPGWAFVPLRRFLYPKAAAVVLQTNGVLNRYPVSIQRNSSVIPNPVVEMLPVKTGKENQKDLLDTAGVVIAMGRLVHQKGFDLLIHAWAKIAERHPEWHLDIWGEGREGPNLQHLILTLALADQVRLRGITKEVAVVLQKSTIFALSSRFEGFPNVLCEAMACSLPTVAFDCPFGPAEIIRDQENGLLVPPEDVAALAEALDFMISNPDRRKRMGENARKITGRLGLENVMVQWEDLLKRVTAY